MDSMENLVEKVHKVWTDQKEHEVLKEEQVGKENKEPKDLKDGKAWMGHEDGKAWMGHEDGKAWMGHEDEMELKVYLEKLDEKEEWVQLCNHHLHQNEHEEGIIYDDDGDGCDDVDEQLNNFESKLE